MQLAQDRDQWLGLVNTVMNLQVPYKAGNFIASQVTISLSRRTLLHGVCSEFCNESHTNFNLEKCFILVF
jgi:hypothetical protein